MDLDHQCELLLNAISGLAVDRLSLIVRISCMFSISKMGRSFFRADVLGTFFRVEHLYKLRLNVVVVIQLLSRCQPGNSSQCYNKLHGQIMRSVFGSISQRGLYLFT